MAHFPKPFFRPKKNRWYVQLDGKQINLGPDEAEAFRRYHAVMAERHQPVPVVVSTVSDPTLAVILDEFLSWCEIYRLSNEFRSPSGRGRLGVGQEERNHARVS